MSDILFVTLLILHVLFIVAWMGSGILFISTIIPSLNKMSESARGEFIRIVLPRYVRLIAGSSVLAIIFGLALYAYLFPPSSGSNPPGLLEVQIGAILGFVALLLVFLVMIPTARKLVRNLTGTTSPSVDMARLQVRMRAAGGIGVLLLLLALIMMLVGASI